MATLRASGRVEHRRQRAQRERRAWPARSSVQEDAHAQTRQPNGARAHFTPCVASSRAHALPKPEAPPVITATLPRRPSHSEGAPRSCGSMRALLAEAAREADCEAQSGAQQGRSVDARTGFGRQVTR
jgi:hypothetical protein